MDGSTLQRLYTVTNFKLIIMQLNKYKINIVTQPIFTIHICCILYHSVHYTHSGPHTCFKG